MELGNGGSMFCLEYLNTHTWGLINPRRACAARVTVVGLCVCVSATILALQATRRPKSDIKCFSATSASKKW